MNGTTSTSVHIEALVIALHVPCLYTLAVLEQTKMGRVDNHRLAAVYTCYLCCLRKDAQFLENMLQNECLWYFFVVSY